VKVEYSSVANLTTNFGVFKLIFFKEEGTAEENRLVYQGELKAQKDVLIRIHSECLMGDVFTSKKCDCGEQLNESVGLIAEKGKGVILYLRQEGRGIGLFNKVNAYALHDTIQSNHSLGFPTDLPDFTIAIELFRGGMCDFAIQQPGENGYFILFRNSCDRYNAINHCS
jgi:GTP cyclohydrolase II